MSGSNKEASGMRAHGLVLRVGQLNRLETARIAALTHVRRLRQRIGHDCLDPLVSGPEDRLVRRPPPRPLIHPSPLPATTGFKRDATANPSASPCALPP